MSTYIFTTVKKVFSFPRLIQCFLSFAMVFWNGFLWRWNISNHMSPKIAFISSLPLYRMLVLVLSLSPHLTLIKSGASRLFIRAAMVTYDSLKTRIWKKNYKSLALSPASVDRVLVKVLHKSIWYWCMHTLHNLLILMQEIAQLLAVIALICNFERSYSVLRSYFLFR